MARLNYKGKDQEKWTPANNKEVSQILQHKGTLNLKILIK